MQAIAWSFPLAANEADFMGRHFFVDKFLPNCSSMLDEKCAAAGGQVLGARISEREIGGH
jgi:hypothetical protein